MHLFCILILSPFFFLRHFQIPLDDEPFVQVKWSFSIGAGVVTSFGYRKDVDGQWIHKQDLPPPIPNERTSSTSPQRVDSSSLLTEVLTELCGLWAFIGERFDAMDTRLDAMDAHFNWMDTRGSLVSKMIWASLGVASIPRLTLILIILYFLSFMVIS